jgi:hypothetical protein
MGVAAALAWGRGERVTGVVESTILHSAVGGVFLAGLVDGINDDEREGNCRVEVSQRLDLTSFLRFSRFVLICTICIVRYPIFYRIREREFVRLNNSIVSKSSGIC